jgi:hypothetical protein
MVAATKERLDRHDREMAAIPTRMREGMRLSVETRKDLRVRAAIQKKHEAGQQRTAEALRDFIGSLRPAGNGRSKGPVS